MPAEDAQAFVSQTSFSCQCIAVRYQLWHDIRQWQACLIHCCMALGGTELVHIGCLLFCLLLGSFWAVYCLVHVLVEGVDDTIQKPATWFILSSDSLPSSSVPVGVADHKGHADVSSCTWICC